jgi:superfamily II DNA or RNA helicase
MLNTIDVTYAQTGQSKKTNTLGMREMQARAYDARASQHILIKAPPASGKSRALMFIALDKLINQGVSKVIVAVPEKSIGSSFATTDLSEHGFYSDWNVRPELNLCTDDEAGSKVAAVKSFLESDEKILICTHASLRFAYDAVDDALFNNCLIAIDEFHHISVSEENRLGELLRSVMRKSEVHIVAMTGSYFRGDSAPVLSPEDEAKFHNVTYNYYEQLNGYNHLKSLGIGYHFYQGKYTSAIHEVLDTDKKTILHIPSVNSRESTGDKGGEVDSIVHTIGKIASIDSYGIMNVERRTDGKIIRVADLVTERTQSLVQGFLRTISSIDDVDLIIALGMAKEGFDWEYCEHSLTVGYRSSLTEVVQIIGRCTRDSSNKNHAQFTNLIAQPDAQDEEVTVSVNNMLKAITCSLLMEQVLAPVFKFKTKLNDDDKPKRGELKIRGFKEPSTKRVEAIILSDLNDLKATILQDDKIIKAIPGNVDPEVINKVMIPKIIQTKYPDLSAAEIDEVRQHVVVDSVIKTARIEDQGDKKFVRMAGKFINIDDININLIDSINPFQKAFEIMSKSVTAPVLKLIKDAIDTTKIKMTDDEAVILWPKVKAFVQEHGRNPKIDSRDPLEFRLAATILHIKKQRREKRI